MRPFAHLPPNGCERQRVLKSSLRIVDLTSKSNLDWGTIAEIAGATLIAPTQQQLDSIAAGDASIDGIDIAIADPEPSKWGTGTRKTPGFTS